jgi:hypothetical protein
VDGPAEGSTDGNKVGSLLGIVVGNSVVGTCVGKLEVGDQVSKLGLGDGILVYGALEGTDVGSIVGSNG